jgi:hypothetical protein
LISCSVGSGFLQGVVLPLIFAFDKTQTGLVPMLFMAGYLLGAPLGEYGLGDRH